jgi:hypothetical protein
VASGLPNGGARPSLFAIRIPNAPTGVVSANQVYQQASYLCTATSLLSSRVDVIEVAYFGRKIKIAGERTFDDWTVTFLNGRFWSS